MVLIYDDSEISINKKKKNEFVMLIKNWDGDYNKFWDNFPVSLMKVVKIDAKSEDTQEIVIKGPGHFIQEEAGPEYAQLIIDFINGNPQSFEVERKDINLKEIL